MSNSEQSKRNFYLDFNFVIYATICIALIVLISSSFIFFVILLGAKINYIDINSIKIVILWSSVYLQSWLTFLAFMGRFSWGYVFLFPLFPLCWPLVLCYFLYQFIINSRKNNINLKKTAFEFFKYVQKSKYLKLSIVGIFKNKLDEKNIYATYLVLIATALYSILGILWEKFEINIYFILGALIYVLLFYLNSFLVNFRIRKGFYGGNEFEAREIINFIEENSDNIDFSDGDSPKKLFNEEDLKEIEKEIMIELNSLPQPNI